MKNRTPTYGDKNGQKYFIKSFCAYFDILGFSQRIIENDISFFNTYLHILEKRLQYIKEFDEYTQFELKIFTDNFVIGHPWYDSSGEPELGQLFHILSHLQFHLATSNIYLRGALSMSDLYMDENIVLGPALLEAYELESKTAIHPRIILSKEVIKTLNIHIGYYAKSELSPQSRQYLVDTDGQYFVNYLYITIDTNFSGHDKRDNRTIKRLIRKHKNSVEQNLKEYNNDPKLFMKYKWVADYHNYFCKTFLGNFSKEVLKDLTISSDLMEKSINRVI